MFSPSRMVSEIFYFVYIHTHVRNAVTLVWGSLRLTHVRNAVTLVWGSLRLAPISAFEL